MEVASEFAEDLTAMDAEAQFELVVECSEKIIQLHCWP
jgi:hypothetical protein